MYTPNIEFQTPKESENYNYRPAENSKRKIGGYREFYFLNTNLLHII